jgi:peptidoglycan/LPS O-acetylase OafA/YrhL
VTALQLPGAPAPRTFSSSPIQGKQIAATTGGRTLEWLDALKGIAIIAVVLDHAFIVDNYELWKHLYFHVSWFIFLAGVANAYSARKRVFASTGEILAMWWRRIASLLPAYLGASALAFLFVYAGRQSLESFGRDLLLFHTLPPLYFIAMLLQLLIAFPLLFHLWYRCGWLGRAVFCAATVAIAGFVSQVVTFPWVLGAHYLLGATFLYLFVLGLALEPLLTGKRISPWIWLILAAPLLIAAERANLQSDGDLMTHPPTLWQIGYSLGSVLLCYALCRILAGKFPIRFFSRIGRRSLDIFAYHYLLILPILQFRHAEWTHRLPFVQGQIALMAAAVPIAIAGSMIIGRLFATTAASILASLPRLSFTGRLPSDPSPIDSAPKTLAIRGWRPALYWRQT